MPSSETVRATERLQVLLVEDSTDDADLITRELRRGGYEPICRRVETQETFLGALGAQTWDIIVSDHSLPAYSGLKALADLRASGKDVPFILVSGTIGESVAVAAMKAGAQDYVLKSDLTRLPEAVRREVREAVGRAEQRKMRQQLTISERMASTGMLAAGLAHEINNPLAAAIANAEYVSSTLARMSKEIGALESGSRAADLRQWLGEHTGEIEESVSEAREALQRIRDIVRDVKLFSRPTDDAKIAVDIRRIVDSSCRMARNEIRQRAQLVKNCGAVPLVQANESRIGQVVLNLLVNAAQAIPEGDTEQHEIRITTRTSESGQAIIEVSDTGNGISPENLERIFDPFFTTKPVGIGTGLGLAICQQIIADLGGQITAESEIGHGTVFRVALPAATKASAALPSNSEPPQALFRARILIIDDDAPVGRSLQRSLAKHHDAIAVTTGPEALGRIADGQLFDVILCDLMMPQVSGIDVHEELLQIAPDAAERIIFLTGGAFTSATREFLDKVPNPRLDKPVELTNLLAMIAGYGRLERVDG